jgi:glycosyltransferase involved in cell wall biosynthesis
MSALRGDAVRMNTDELLRILILLPYYNRPKMVRNALTSIMRAHVHHPKWTLAFIDDGSPEPGEPVVEEICEEVLEQVVVYQTGDTYETKVQQGGSRHGAFMNRAIREIEADVCIMLSDDDAIRDDYLANLSRFFLARPDAQSCYSHIWAFDPYRSSPWASPEWPHALNHNTEDLIECSCTVDSSQVAWRRQVNLKHDVWFMELGIFNLDAAFYSRLNAMTGPTPFSGFTGQFKGFHQSQLGTRGTVEAVWKQAIDL